MTAGEDNLFNEEAKHAYFQKVGARIRYFRQLRGYTNYEKFANQFNLSRSLYGQYEKGRNLTLETLCKILIALEVSQREFFEDFEDIRYNKP
jgi:transcriptional regulator with XRE-family HTH domain